MKLFAVKVTLLCLLGISTRSAHSRIIGDEGDEGQIYVLKKNREKHTWAPTQGPVVPPNSEVVYLSANSKTGPVPRPTRPAPTPVKPEPKPIKPAPKPVNSKTGPVPRPTRPAPKPVLGPVVIFRDDFSGSSLDFARWLVDSHSEGRSQFGSTPIITGGMARLTFDTFKFKATETYTKQSFSRGTYGLEIEARIRFATPRPSGLVASFFTYFETASGAADGIEMNLLSKQINKAGPDPIELETYDDFTGNEVLPYFKSQTTYVAGLDVGTWHIYVIRWLPGKTEWLVDGKVVASTNQAQPNAASSVCLSFWAADSDWSEAYDKNFQPASNAGSNQRYYYDVDYVEVRQRNS